MSEQQKCTLLCECRDCKGTGLYVDAYCHDGAATVCGRCEGKGFEKIPYTPFTSRKKRDGVLRVFPSSSFVPLYPSVHVFPDETMIDYSKYGCSYEEWLNGQTPKPLSKV